MPRANPSTTGITGFGANPSLSNGTAIYGGVHQKSLHYAKQGYARNLAIMPCNSVIPIATTVAEPAEKAR